MPSNESPLNLVRGPARKSGWAQLIRLGGDGVAILFGELRKLVGRIDGVVERLHYSAKEERWVVQYRVEDAELFTVWISPGLLEAGMTLNRSDVGRLLRNHNLSGTVRDALRAGATEPEQDSIRFPLKDRRRVRSFSNLARAKYRLLVSSRGGNP
ncbi:MAG: hypothetical protein WB819_09410 [Terriglobia bacterium]